jgi:prevent-host-death family protein
MVWQLQQLDLRMPVDARRHMVMLKAEPFPRARARGPIETLRAIRTCGSLVTVTRKQIVRPKNSPQPLRGRWRLQDAKARFSELARLAHSEGPQHVTLHGRDAVVVIDADEFLRLKGERSGQLLVDALQASPHRDIEIEPRRSVMPVRRIAL